MKTYTVVNEVDKFLYHCTYLLHLPYNVFSHEISIAYRVSQLTIRLILRLSFVYTNIHKK